MRILLLADTHIGFDLPSRPRVTRRRRGHDFLANFRRALQPALAGEVDLVVHGGDLLHRSKVPPGVVEMAMQPLMQVAASGIPVYLVPGNHERSQIPMHLWASHPLIHIFDRPRTFLQAVGDRTVALSGFPFVRDVRDRFTSLIEVTDQRRVEADVSLLCIHQAVEGSRVGNGGQGDFTFRYGTDVVRGHHIPPGFDAVLSGHIHRAQVLRQNLHGVPLAAPVIYPGSVERTSWAERGEEKVCAVVTVDESGASARGPCAVEWVPLHARPMVDLTVRSAPAREAFEAELLGRLHQLQSDAIVRVHLQGPPHRGAQLALGAQNLRRLAPATMNISAARVPEAG
jgi:DNA repair exonuclease SbcCD nuclease subunit